MVRARLVVPMALALSATWCPPAWSQASTSQDSRSQDFKEICTQLSRGVPDAGRIIDAIFLAAGPVTLPPPAPGAPSASVPAPDHCLVRGKLNERTGMDGKPYAIGYEIRLPAAWNGKFLFEGGGGSDGVLRPALDVIPFGAPKPNALTAGYVAATTDAGHLDEPGPVGSYLFGLDPQARNDKGYSSIPPVTGAARALMTALYGRAPARSYFAGCSNGGRQAMVVTQRYPAMFDGVVAVAPAYRVPLAAIDAIGHTQALMSIAPQGADGAGDLGSALSDGDLKTLSAGITDACDAADGIKDGMVQSLAACRFDPAVLACKAGSDEAQASIGLDTKACLSDAKIAVIKRMFAGTRNAKGERIYSDWPYDPGITGAGWRAWRLGTPKANPPNARNVTLIPGSIAYAFMSPPETPTDLLDWELKFDVDKDPPRVMTPRDGFDAGMQFEAATSTDLDVFKARGGKIIFAHGTADPIFSPLDTIRYWQSLQDKYGAGAQDFSRLFLIPGMNHCAGGPSTDDYDAVTALDAWVEQGTAPAMLLAKARSTPEVPWPGRTRPLCPYPKVTTYNGSGDIERADSFTCR